ncbi:hypothetical protein CH304_12845 [Rhodococcus sp. 15-649-1-2]|nr:ADP-ribosyltransferase [Rhodococcus sp. 15-649-1-2]OZE81932.1 hypothetical protein CH304_12845 [Rhodococcus sp. 15-649-1-2]
MTPDEQRVILDSLNLSATQNIDNLWRNASRANFDSSQFREVMIQGVPELVDSYAAAAGDIATVWYEDAAPDLSYLATPAELVPAEQLEASTSWALRADGESALTRIAGFTARAIFGSARRTIVENSEKEPGATWARHAQAGSCAFCRMLATRSEVYASKASATTARGRDKYHDHCRCTAVAVRPGQVYTPPDYVEQWEEQYQQAVRATSDGRAINVQAVLAKMDELGHAAARVKKAVNDADTTAAWLAAETEHRDNVIAWLDAENAYDAAVPPRTLTESDGRALGVEVWRDYAESVADADRIAVRTYTGDTYEPINEYLRGLTATITDEHRDAVDRIDRVIANAPRVPEKMTVSRAVGADVFGLKPDANPSALVGRTFTDDGFMSTSLQSELKSLNRHEVELRLDLPEGTPGLYVSSHSKRDEKGLAVYGMIENELLLGRGVSYEIVDAYEENGRRILLGRVVEQRQREQ